MPRRLYLAAYDVRDRTRLRKALKVARAFATGGQKSVHECWLDSDELALLRKNMALVIDHDIDQFALIALDPRRQARLHGIAVKPASPDYFSFT